MLYHPLGFDLWVIKGSSPPPNVEQSSKCNKLFPGASATCNLLKMCPGLSELTVRKTKLL